MAIPNFFSNAVKELSQDAFIVWLLQWADPEHKSANPALHELGQSFVRLCFPDTELGDIKKVNAWRQEANIDVFAVINDSHVLVIENKLFSGEHSEQLQRYQTYTKTHYGDRVASFCYLMLGNKETAYRSMIQNRGYSIIDRKSILNHLKNTLEAHPLVADFYRFVDGIQIATDSWTDSEKFQELMLPKEGFFMELEKQFDQGGAWGYVSNQSGGFMYFTPRGTYQWSDKAQSGAYVQLESYFGGETRVVVKLSDFEGRELGTDTLYHWLGLVTNAASNHGLTLLKPDRFSGTGSTRTLAILSDPVVVYNNGTIDFQEIATKINKLNASIGEFLMSTSI